MTEVVTKCDPKILEDIVRTPGSLWITIPAARRRRWRRERKKKQGSRAGALMRLCKQPHKPLLPSICLTNTTSLAYELDELQTAINKTVRGSCILLITETWLHALILMPVKLAGCTVHRTKDSGKSEGGGL